jgi:hypothetical protein
VWEVEVEVEVALAAAITTLFSPRLASATHALAWRNRARTSALPTTSPSPRVLIRELREREKERKRRCLFFFF